MRHTHMDMDIDTGTCTRRDSDFEKKFFEKFKECKSV